MSVDVVDLREFYATPLGKAALASIMRTTAKSIDNSPEGIVVGLGYPVPYLDALNAHSAIALMPARQGAVQWPDESQSRTALVEDDELPIPNASVDLVIMVHVLENAVDPIETLNEAWRIMAPEARLFIVVANRRGIWAKFEHTPFGNGRPFSRRQLKNLLREAKLTPISWSDALHFPPVRMSKLLNLRGFFEGVARRIWPAFSGVITVEATKRLYQGIPVNAKRSKRVLIPALSPQGTTRAGRTIDNVERSNFHPDSFL